MEQILRATFADPDRQEAHDSAKAAVENDVERLLAEYRARDDTFEGRYICADSFKELFPSLLMADASLRLLSTF